MLAKAAIELLQQHNHNMWTTLNYDCQCCYDL